MNNKLLVEVKKFFEDYYDQDLIDEEINKNYSLIENNYNNEDEIDKDIHIVTMLKNKILISIINRVKNEDLDSELYLIEKYGFIHDLYSRRHGIEGNNILYEGAMSDAINNYDGFGSFTVFLYNSICKKYKSKSKESIKKELTIKK